MVEVKLLLIVSILVTVLTASSFGRSHHSKKHHHTSPHKREQRHRQSSAVHQQHMVIEYPENLRYKRAINEPGVGDNPPSSDSSAGSSQLKPRIYYLHVESKVTSRFATTLAVAKLANAASESKEVTFTVILPNAAFISNFSMEINKTVIVGRVEEKEVAKQQYERAKAAGQSAGQVAQEPRETNKFVISVNLAAASKVTFNLTYQEILKRVHGAYKLITNIQPGQPVDDIRVRVQIFEDAEINFVHVPAFGPKVGEKTNKELLKEPVINDPRLDIEQTVTAEESTAVVTYSPTAEESGGGSNVAGQLVVLYDVRRTPGAGELKVVNGYFVHFFSPSDVEAGNKHVVFVLDKSGSMRGTKIQQTKDAMKLILKDLEPGDYFNILLFSDTVQMWREESIAATADNLANANIYVDQIEAFGGTNINEALQSSLQLLHGTTTSALTSLVIFLTDGEPTSGITRPDSILANAKRANEGNFPIHCIGFGKNADFELLQKISAQNRGLARKVYEDSDSALQLEGFYSEISNPLLTEVDIKYLNETVSAESLVQDHSYNLYEGSEYIITGKLADDQAGELTTEITARSKAGPKEFRTICIIPPHPIPYPIESATPSGPLPASSLGGFVERMWAYLTIKKLLDDSKFMTSNETEAASLKSRALELSLKYNFVTELTSMVVTTPEQNVTSDGEESDGVKLAMGEDAPADVHHNSRMLNSYPSGAIPVPVYYNSGHRGAPGMPGPVRSGSRYSRPGHGADMHMAETDLDPTANLFESYLDPGATRMAPPIPQTNVNPTTAVVPPQLELLQGIQDQTLVELSVPKIELECCFRNNHQLQFKWFKNDESVLEELNRVTVQSTFNTTKLVIHNPFLADTGSYECRAYSPVVKQMLISAAQITVTAATPSTSQLVEIESGADANIIEDNTVEAEITRRKRQSNHFSKAGCPRREDGCPSGCQAALSPIGCLTCSCHNWSNSSCKPRPLCDLGCTLMRDASGCMSKCYCPNVDKLHLPMRFLVPMLNQDYTLCVDYNAASWLSNKKNVRLLQLNGDTGSTTDLTAKFSEVMTDQYMLPIMTDIHLTKTGERRQHLTGRDQRNGYKSLDKNITLHFQRIKYEKACPCDVANVRPHWQLTSWKQMIRNITDAVDYHQLPTRGILGQMAFLSRYCRVEMKKTRGSNTLPLLVGSSFSKSSDQNLEFPLTRYVFDVNGNQCLQIDPKFLFQRFLTDVELMNVS